MSRKWERQIERNTKRANAMRKRLGQTSIHEAAKGDDRHMGRSWMLSSLLVFVGLFYLITFWNVNRDGLFWVTVIAYLLLALIVFAFRRPFLSIGKQSLTTRKFAGFRTVKADEIEEIEAQNGYVVISMKTGKTRWVFSRLLHRYDTNKMADKLEEFARANQVKFKRT